MSDRLDCPLCGGGLVAMAGLSRYWLACRPCGASYYASNLARQEWQEIHDSVEEELVEELGKSWE